jgi:hypothetical protein
MVLLLLSDGNFLFLFACWFLMYVGLGTPLLFDLQHVRSRPAPLGRPHISGV